MGRSGHRRIADDGTVWDGHETECVFRPAAELRAYGGVAQPWTYCPEASAPRCTSPIAYLVEMRTSGIQDLGKCMFTDNKTQAPRHRRVSHPSHSVPTDKDLSPVLLTQLFSTPGDDSTIKFSTSPLL